MNELEWNGMRLCLVNLDGTHSAQTHQKTLQFNYFSFHHRKHSSHFKRLVAWMRLKRLHRELAVLIWHLAIIIHNYCYYIVFTASAVRCVCVCVCHSYGRDRDHDFSHKRSNWTDIRVMIAVIYQLNQSQQKPHREMPVGRSLVHQNSHATAIGSWIFTNGFCAK